MKTAIDQAIELLLKGVNKNDKKEKALIDDVVLILRVIKQTEYDQLRAAYNNSCHEISFDEYYRNKYERKEQISPKDMGDNKEA